MIVDAIDALVAKQKFAGLPVNFGGSSPPSSPVDNEIWFESPIGSAPYPQPWQYNAANSIWLSAPFLLDFGSTTFTATNYVEKSIPFYGVTGLKTYVRQIVGIISNQAATAHTSSNYYSFAVRYTTGAAVPLPETNLYTLTTDTGINPSALAASASRRVLENPNSFVPGNAWSLRFNATKTGTPSNIYCHFGIWLQFARS